MIHIILKGIILNFLHRYCKLNPFLYAFLGMVGRLIKKHFITFTEGVSTYSGCIKQLVNSMTVPKNSNQFSEKRINHRGWLFCRQNSQ